MARLTKIKLGPHGLCVRADGRDFRPGYVSYVSLSDMSDGGLVVGEQVRASHISGTTRCRVTRLRDGHQLLWHNDYQHAKEAELQAALQSRKPGIPEMFAGLHASLDRLPESPPARLQGTILAMPLDAFLVGAKADGTADGEAVIDATVGRTLERLVVELQPGDLDPLPDAIVTPSQAAPGYTFVETAAGVILLAPDGGLAGLYGGAFGLCDITIAPSHQGRGLGAELVLEYALRRDEMPIWDLETPLYTPAGMAAHRRAWTLARQDHPMVADKLERLHSASAAPAGPAP